MKRAYLSSDSGGGEVACSLITLCGEPTLVKEERVDRMEGARGGVMEHGEEAAPFSEDTRALIRGHGGRTGGSTFCPSESRAAKVLSG
jgi:hypothetical protein